MNYKPKIHRNHYVQNHSAVMYAAGCTLPGRLLCPSD